jgi:peptidoglycan hydrolase-like protein with peptidoglycan-binding domain
MTTAFLPDPASMETLQRKIVSALASGSDLREVLLGDEARGLLRVLRLPRRFDRALCDDVLFAAATAGPEALEALRQIGLVQPVSGRPGWFQAVEDSAAPRTASPDDADDVLAAGGERWRALHRALALRFESLGADGELEALFHWMTLGDARGEQRWNALYDSARDAFDLARCETLLKLLDACARYVGPALATRGTLERGLLGARAAFAEDHSRTSRYLERNALRDAFEALLADDHRFILQLHAAGGSGKTMFLRWLGPRWCLPEGVPIARVDFDFLDVTERGLPNAFMLGKLAERLNAQLPGAPLFELLRDVAEERRRVIARPFAFDAGALARLETEVRQRLARVLVECCGGGCVVLVFDTMEDASLKHEIDMSALIESIAALRRQLLAFATEAGAPRLVLILAGRYPLAHQYPQAYEAFESELVDFEIPPFDPAESLLYLQRRLAGIAQQPEAGVVELVVERARGNPFKLSLYADILLSEPDITAQALGQDVDVDMLYLIERILRRIDDEALRWLLRYGVLARRLTRGFVEQVLLAPMRQSLRGNTRNDDPSQDGVRHREWPRLWVARKAPPLQPADVTELWQRLRSYASASSWISADADGADAVVIQPIASHPMRRALLKKDRRVVAQIHRAAIAHARRSVASGPVLADLTYHDFALRGPRAASGWWTLVRARLQQRDFEQVQALASVVLSEDLRESELPLEDGSLLPLVDDRTRARALHGLAQVHCERWRQDPAAAGKDLARARAFLEQFDDIATTLPGPAVDRVSDGMLRLELMGHETHQRDVALHELEAALGTRLDTRVRGEVLRTLQRTWAPLDPARARQFGLRRLRWALGARDASAFGAILMAQVRDRQESGQPYAALKILVSGQQELKSRAARWLVREAARHASRGLRDEEPRALNCAGLPGAGLHRQEQIHFAAGAVAGEAPRFDARCTRASLLLQSGRLRETLGACDELARSLPGGAARDTLRARALQVEVLSMQAHAARRLMQFDAALDAMSQATALQSQLGDHAGEIDTRLQMARMQMLDIGDLRIAAEQLQDTDGALSEESVALQFAHACLRVVLASLRGDAGSAATLLDRAADLQRRLPAGYQRLRCGIELALLGLRSGRPEQQLANARALGEHWSTMDYVGARLALATGLRHVGTIDSLPGDLCRRLEGLTRVAPLRLPGQQRLLAEDRIRLTMSRVDLLRVIGRKVPAHRELRALGYLLHQQAPGLWMRDFARCCDRLGVSPDEFLPAGWFARVVSGVRRTPYLMSLIYLEAAERSATIDQNAKKALALLENSTKAWNVDKAPRSFLHVRQLSLQARLREATRTAAGDVDRLAGRIADLRDRLGCPPETIVPVPLDTVQEPDAQPLSMPSIATGLRWVAPGEVYNIDHTANGRGNQTQHTRDLESPFDKSLATFAYSRDTVACESIVGAMLGAHDGEFDAQMAEASLTPRTLQRLVAAERGERAPLELILESRHKSLRTIPWELMAPRGVDSAAPPGTRDLPITLRPGVGCFWRAPFAFSLKPRVAWAQRALNLLSNEGLNEDAHFGRRTMKALARFQQSTGIDATGVIDARTIAKLAQCVRDRAPTPAPARRRALLITPDRMTNIVSQRGSDVSGTSLEWTYRARGVDVETLHEPDIDLLRSKLAVPFDVVHIAGPIAQSRSTGSLSLQFAASHVESHATALSPGLLARVLAGVPLVVIEVPRSTSETETVMQLLLRNAFATQLVDLGDLHDVMAIGFAQPSQQQRMCDTLVESICEGVPPVESVDRLRRLPPTGPGDAGLHVTGLYSTAGIALFSRDPFICELPQALS